MRLPGRKALKTVIGEEQRTSMNSIVVNNVSRPKPEGRLVADMLKGQKKLQCCTTHTVTTWNVKSTNHSKLEIVKQET